MLVVAMMAGVAIAAEFKCAEPVWPKGMETERNLFVGFRTRIDGNAKTLRYSASSIARVWLNGEFLSYGPARGPHGYDRIDEIDLTDRVTNGVNVLAFEIAGYNVDSFYFINEPASLAAEVLNANGEIVAATKASGAFEAFVLDERVQKVPRFSFQRPFCEVYELKNDWSAWRTGAVRKPVELAKASGSPHYLDRVFPYPDYTVSKIFKPIRAGVLEVREPEVKNVGRSVYGEDDPVRSYSEKEIVFQPVYEVRKLVHKESRDVVQAMNFSDHDYALLDHGLCDTGFLGARVICTKPGRLYFHFDEVMVNGDVDVSRMGWQCVNTITYDFKEPGVYEVEAFEPNTFRYLKVMADGFAGKVANVYLRGYKNAAALKAKFATEDPALAKIFAAARETFAQNAVDAYTDCPSRERAGWLCDSFFSSRAEKALTGRSDVERGFLQNYALCPKTLCGGFLPECYPSDGEDFIPNWNLWLILEVGEYLERTGDRETVDLLRPKLEGVIAAFHRYRNADGLLEKLPGWGFVEWSFANKLVQDVSYPSNMLYAEALDAMSKLYGLADFAAEAKQVRETIRKQSWTGEWFCDNAVRQEDGSLKLSGECTETCQYYAFFFHVATPELHPELWKRLITEFGPHRKLNNKYPKIHFSNAFIGNFLRLELLSRAGLSDQLIKEIKGYFLNMAETTGTLWEHDNTSASCVHGFASHVAVWLIKHVPDANLNICK